MKNSSQIKLSVIVPIYNVESYLDDCILSILKQTYPFFELILIDDGSTDGSGKICDKYQKNDHRIIVVHKTNGGLSSARNEGLRISTGKYISFIDSDDYIDENTFLSMLNFFKENIDIVCCGRYRDYKGKKIAEHIVNDSCVLSKKDAVKEILCQGMIDVSCCDKIFRAELLKGIRFKEGVINEDLMFVFASIAASRCIYYVNKPYYNYRVRENSITTLPTYNDKSIAYYDNLMELKELLIANSLFVGADYSVYSAYVYQVLMSMIECTKDNGKYKDKMRFFYNRFRKELPFYLKCKKIGIKKKIMSIIHLMHLHKFYLKIRGYI